MNGYYDSWVEDRPRAMQEDFGFSEVDDFLTQTLSSLQDLDIPVGEPQQSQNSTQYNNANYTPQMRGHKKQPSGTAIFGFVGHNRTLSIPGTAALHSKKPSVARQVIAPQQIFQQEHNQQIRQEPVLFQTPEEFQMAHIYGETGPKPSTQQMDKMIYPPPQPERAPHSIPLSHQVPPQQQEQHSEDYIVTNKTPFNYKFPPDPPRGNTHMENRQHQGQPQQPYPVQYQQQPHYMPYNPAMGPPPPPPPHPAYPQQHMPPQRHPQKTVQVPVEYLQRLTRMVHDTNGVDMENFLNYDFDKLEYTARPDMGGASSPLKSEMSPVLKSYAESSATSNNTRGPSPEAFQDLNSSPMKPPQMVALPSSPPKQAKFIHSNKSIGLGIKKESGEELAEPNTPSPILGSHATFFSSPVKNDISWTPIVIGTGDPSAQQLQKKKIYDKVSTLPPGEIDQYVIGPREDRTFICGYNGCGKMFTRRYNVRSHVQTHLSDRPFLCQVPGCNKAFVRQHDLTRHKKIHQEFAFACECGKRFSRHDALFRHRARNICCGGLNAEEVARIELRQAQTSVQKKRNKERPNIRVANDTVAKRLEFDLLGVQKRGQTQGQAHGKSQSTPASPQSRKISGASTVSASGEDDDVFEEDEFAVRDEGDDDEEAEDKSQTKAIGSAFQITVKAVSREQTPCPGTSMNVGMLQEFNDDEDNVFLDNLHFDHFDDLAASSSTERA